MWVAGGTSLLSFWHDKTFLKTFGGNKGIGLVERQAAKNFAWVRIDLRKEIEWVDKRLNMLVRARRIGRRLRAVGRDWRNYKDLVMQN